MIRLLVAAALVCAASGLGCELLAGVEERVLAADGAGASGGLGAGGSGAGAQGSSRWPDSPTQRCSDGESSIDECPSVGAPGNGQDCCYEIQVPTYQADGADHWHDSVTDLVWQPASSNSSTSWADANMTCGEYLVGGLEWRLPSRLELASLLDYGAQGGMSGVDDDIHWTSSQDTTDGSYWAINFGNRTPYTLDPESDAAFVLCVAGAPLQGTWTDTAGIVRDSLTGLAWDTASVATRTWLGALARCESWTTDGVEWRLPSAKELLTLTKDDASVPPEFDGLPAEWYWSSTPDPGAADRAFALDFPDGFLTADVTWLERSTICVSGPADR